MKDLNEQYRAEGWGKITDAAFQGRVQPEDVESQAREVARYAHKTISELVETLKECRIRATMSNAMMSEIADAIHKAKI